MRTHVTTSTSVDVEVDIDFAEIVAGLDQASRSQLAQMLLSGSTHISPSEVPFGGGEGDAQRIESIIERAFNAARALPQPCPELAELFYVVHGRAMA